MSIKKETDMIYGYIRVSTDRQNTENQRFEIKKFCERNELSIDCWIEEKISSTMDLNKRKLGRLLRRIKKDDLIITSELSRLGRNLLQVMSILHHCMDIGAKIWTIKDNYRLGSDITSKVLAFAFGLSAEIERNLISQRTKRHWRALKPKASGLAGHAAVEMCPNCGDAKNIYAGVCLMGAAYTKSRDVCACTATR